MTILNTCNFQKKMLSNLTLLLIGKMPPGKLPPGKLPPPPHPSPTENCPPRKLPPGKLPPMIFGEFFLVSNLYFYGYFRL